MDVVERVRVPVQEHHAQLGQPSVATEVEAEPARALVAKAQVAPAHLIVARVVRAKERLGLGGVQPGVAKGGGGAHTQQL